MAKRLSFLRNRSAQVLTLLLLAQASLIGVLAPAEKVSLSRPLAQIPEQLSTWNSISDNVIEPEVQELLKADDTLNRTYQEAGSSAYANLFIAFFKTQRAGVAPHSPKVCLPGAGWVPTESDTMDIPISGRATSIHVNRYIVAKGDEKSVVIYWYQTPYRVMASEFTAKFYTMVDGLRYHRSDTALVRVVVPVIGTEKAAESEAVQFIRGFFNTVSKFLPA